jgi:hypothetical protein
MAICGSDRKVELQAWFRVGAVQVQRRSQSQSRKTRDDGSPTRVSRCIEFENDPGGVHRQGLDNVRKPP